MCWEIDYKFLVEQKKEQESRIKRERREGAIEQLMNDANKQGEKTKVEVRRSRSHLRNNPSTTPA